MSQPMRYRLRGDLQWQYTENPDHAAHAHEVQRLQPVLEWIPITPELLTAIEAGDHGSHFWLAAPGVESPFLGNYVWRPGRNPHGFETENRVRWNAPEL